MIEYLLSQYMENKDSISEEDFIEFLKRMDKKEITPEEHIYHSKDIMKELHKHPEIVDFMYTKMASGQKQVTDVKHFCRKTSAKIVEDMYHCIGTKEIHGEIFDINKAKEVYSRYYDFLSSGTTIYDVYVSINAQYHDYSELFKAWFGGGLLEDRIIESAIIFWFKDIDYKHGNKIWTYFHK